MPDAQKGDLVMVPPEIPVLAVRSVDKRFPGVHALRAVSFDIRPGEVHAVVGENGAGKSTLMRVLSGVYAPDGGAVIMGGDEVTLTSPQNAFQRGIAMVWQDTRLAPTLDVAWNISLGHETGGRVLVDRASMIATAKRALARIGSTVDPLAQASTLSRAQMQQVEIARALSRDARVLILDEPTSALTPAETSGLFKVLSELQADGTAIIFISHRLPEVLDIADRITVMRDGEVTGTVDTKDTSEAQLVSLMVGRSMGLEYPRSKSPPGDVALDVENLDILPGPDGIGLRLTGLYVEIGEWICKRVRRCKVCRDRSRVGTFDVKDDLRWRILLLGSHRTTRCADNQQAIGCGVKGFHVAGPGIVFENSDGVGPADVKAGGLQCSENPVS